MVRSLDSAWQGLDHLESRQLLAFVLWDGGGGDSSWHNPLNWSNDALPTAADNVLIDAPGSPTIRLHNNTPTSVASLWTLDKLEISAGSLSVAGDWKQSAPLAMTGGTIQGAGKIILNGDFLWTGGTIRGSSPLLVYPGRTMTIDGNVTLARELINNGSLIWASGSIATDGARIRNLIDRTFSIQSPGSLYKLAGGATSYLTNYGTLIRDGAAATTTTIGINYSSNTSLVTAPPNGVGTVDAHSGTLLFTGVVEQKQGATLLGGKWKVSSSDGRLLLPGPDIDSVWSAAGGSVELNGAGAAFPQLEGVRNIPSLKLSGGRAFTFANLLGQPLFPYGPIVIFPGLPIAGLGQLILDNPGATTIHNLAAGNLSVESGSVTLTGAPMVRMLSVDQDATVTFAGGTLEAVDFSGAGLIRITGNVTWQSGSISGPGQLLIAQGANLHIHGRQDLYGYDIDAKRLSRRTINYGTILWDDADNSLSFSGELVNRGTFNIDRPNFWGTMAGVSGNAPGLIQNFGTINSHQSITLRGAGGGIKLVNTGTVNVRAGTLALNGGSGGGGHWQIFDSAELIFGGLAGTLSNATIGGVGRLRVANASTWTNVAISGGGDVVVGTAGRLKLQGTSNSSTRTAFSNLGTLELTPASRFQVVSDMTSSGRILLSTGQLVVTGALTLTSTSVLSVLSSSPSSFGRLNVNGPASLSGTLTAIYSWAATPSVTFTFFTSNSINGGLGPVTSQGLTPGFGAQLLSNGPALSLRVVAFI